jgi:hypothetical protein
VLVGLLANATLDWWADPLTALGIAVIPDSEAVRTGRAESHVDTCCH